MNKNLNIFDNKIMDNLSIEAKKAKRLRRNLNIHKSYDDKCQKLLNAIGKESYIRPHMHSFDSSEELLVAIKGCFVIFTFNDIGEINEIIKFSSEKYHKSINDVYFVQIKKDTWHTVIAKTENAVLLEVKEGPFKPSSSKVFAEWSPIEDSPESSKFLKDLHILSS